MLTLTHPDGQVFAFDAGALCLELLVSGGAGERARYELLHRPADFPRWAAAGRLDLPGHGIDPAGVRAGPADLRLVRSLREAVWSAAVRAVRGERPAADDTALINELAAGPAPVPRLDPATGRSTWRTPVTALQLVGAYARDAVATFAEPTIRRLRKCANPVCALHYLDTSRPGQRRWCSMQRCGNRHKVHEYRRREHRGHEA